jgi:hypothetical protein
MAAGQPDAFAMVAMNDSLDILRHSDLDESLDIKSSVDLMRPLICLDAIDDFHGQSTCNVPSLDASTLTLAV